MVESTSPPQIEIRQIAVVKIIALNGGSVAMMLAVAAGSDHQREKSTMCQLLELQS